MDRRRFGLQRADETEIQAAVEDRVDLLVGRHLLKDKIHHRVRSSKVEQQPLKFVDEGGRTKEPDPDFADLSTMHAFGQGGGAAYLAEYLVRLLKKDLPRACQFHPAIRSLEEASTDLALLSLIHISEPTRPY